MTKNLNFLLICALCVLFPAQSIAAKDLGKVEARVRADVTGDPGRDKSSLTDQSYQTSLVILAVKPAGSFRVTNTLSAQTRGVWINARNQYFPQANASALTLFRYARRLMPLSSAKYWY